MNRAWPARLALGVLTVVVRAADPAPMQDLDIGNPEMPAIKGFGWGRDENDGKRSFAWIREIEGDVWFQVDEPREAELELTAAPYHLDRIRQSVGVFINNRFAMEWMLPHIPGMHFSTFTGRAPSGLFSNGLNRITLRMGYTADHRGGTYALAVDRIALRWSTNEDPNVYGGRGQSLHMCK